jgi:glucokinase
MPTSKGLGVDVGGTRIKWSVVNADDKPTARGEVVTPRLGGADLVDQIVQLVRKHGSECASVGLAVPGIVNTQSRETVFIPNIPGAWASFPLGRTVESATEKPVALLNDARAFGFAELHAGAGRGLTDALFLVLGTGIGGALARNGHIVIDDIDCVPEMGHVAVEVHGDRCGCGATGCLETVASASAVVAHSVRAVLTGQSPTLTALCGGRVQDLTAETVAEAADEGDAWALAAFERAGTYIGMAAATSCVMLRASAVIVGGGLAGAFRHLAPAIERVVNDRAALIGRVPILQAQLGAHAGSIGAALYSRELTKPSIETPRDHPDVEVEN